MKPKLLLHCCCASCATHVIERLNDYFEVQLFFCNSNIYPEDEYNKRLEDMKKIAKVYNKTLEVCEYSHEEWLSLIWGFEKEKEGGKRCYLCIRYRLEKTAKHAQETGVDYFATTLTISPHKNHVLINHTGKEIAYKHGVDYLISDFKKQDGFKKSVELSKKYNLSRQNYCGCEFSREQ
ncbi:MAG: epoxyqueuosine reductase QueH [Nanoarchaeota archaeon]